MYDNPMADTIEINGGRRNLEDIVISAVRYALPRHTYVVDDTICFVTNNADVVLSERSLNIIYRDVDNALIDYDRCKKEGSYIQNMDYYTILAFKEWLGDYADEHNINVIYK